MREPCPLDPWDESVIINTTGFRLKSVRAFRRFRQRHLVLFEFETSLPDLYNKHSSLRFASRCLHIIYVSRAVLLKRV